MAQETQNIMKHIKLDKVVLNMGVGKSGDAIEIAKKAYRDWGVRKGEPIGAAVTVRGDDAKSLLKKLFEAKGNNVKSRSIDRMGNISFGILEHIDIPGIKYDPKIGILGLDVSVRLTRPGYNISIRSKHKASIGKTHRISPAEAKEYLVKEFGVVVS